MSERVLVEIVAPLPLEQFVAILKALDRARWPAANPNRLFVRGSERGWIVFEEIRKEESKPKAHE